MSHTTRTRIREKPDLFVMIGCSRCGKSTWANHHRKELNATIVCRDDIRIAMGTEYNPSIEQCVSLVSHYMIKSLLQRGQNVIADETNLTPESRAEYVEYARLNRAQVTFCIVTPFEDEKKWLEQCRKDHFPWSVIKEQVAKYQPPTTDEVETVHAVIFIKEKS